MKIAETLESYALDVMGARALATVKTRTDLARLLFKYADEAAGMVATVETSDIAEAVGLRYIMTALNDSAILAQRHGAVKLAERLIRAAYLSATAQDKAQLRLLGRLGLRVETDPRNMGAKLGEGVASVADLLGLERFENPACRLALA